MFTISKAFSCISAAAALSFALVSTAGAQTVVGGFAKNGGSRIVQNGAAHAADALASANESIADDLRVARQKAARSRVPLNTQANVRTTTVRGAFNSRALNSGTRLSTNSVSNQTVRLPGGGTTRIMAPKARTAGLPKNLKGGIENLSRATLDTVRVHHDSKPSGKIRARAYAKGTKIHLGPGQAKHLPHETWHVTQQKSGRIRPLSNRSNSLNLAKEADALGKTRRASTSVKSAKTVKTANGVRKSARFAKNAKTANTIRKGAKTANTARNVGKAALMGTGVGAVVGVTAGLAGVDPVEMAMLKATNPGEYNRRMRDLKKNPMKYMGNNIKNNTVKTVNDVKKAGQAVGNATKKAADSVGKATQKAAADVGKATKTAASKVGCGVGNIFKKKSQKKKC